MSLGGRSNIYERTFVLKSKNQRQEGNYQDNSAI